MASDWYEYEYDRGASETNSGDPGYTGPSLPPDVAAELHERAQARAAASAVAGDSETDDGIAKG